MRLGAIWMFASAMTALQAQTADPLAPLAEKAEKASTEWAAQATTLETRLTHLLPCDAAVRASIGQAKTASDARLAALTDYWLGALAQSKTLTESAQVLLGQESAGTAEWRTDQADLAQEVAAIEGMMADLRESASLRPALGEAQKTLDGIAATARAMAARTTERESGAAAISTDLRALLEAGQVEQTVIDAELKSLAAEGARWNLYYAARDQRAQTECTITNPTTPAPRPARTTATKSAAKKKKKRVNAADQ